jgi:aminobenzoyl-glutamate utilization protein B
MKTRIATVLAVVCLGSAVNSQPASVAPPRPELVSSAAQDAVAWVESHEAEFRAAALHLHEFAEPAWQEVRSAGLLADLMERHGFRVQRGVAGLPTAFVASWGSGQPIIGVLAEYDALPGLSQKAGGTTRDEVQAGAPGHGCGHNLFGPASCAAALGIKAAMEKRQIAGTVRLYGCPAEETVEGKVYMARAGLFNDLDACLCWHPSDTNEVWTGSSTAMNSFEVVFRGRTAHAGGAPWSGRSALDAVELMNAGVNFLREHMPTTARIHYVIPEGGKAPNVVPDYARVWYFVRSVDRKSVEELYGRVLKCAEGAALMTETTREVKFITGVHNRLPNRVLSAVVHRHLTTLGLPRHTEEELSYARALQRSLGLEETGIDTEIRPFDEPKELGGGSTDVADVNWIVPCAGDLRVATAPIDVPAHHWGFVSSSGSTIGLKGMLTVGKVLAASGVEILLRSDVREQARAEFREKTKGQPYKCPLPADQKPLYDPHR